MQARPTSSRSALATLLALLAAPLAGGCSAADPPPAAAPQEAGTGSCLPDATGFLRAQLRGAFNADLDWKDAQIRCEGGHRPDGSGVRVSIVGPLPESAGPAAGRTLRFVFGIEAAADAQEGSALPTNLTLIIEGAGTGGGAIYATRGDDKCTTDRMQRHAVAGSPRSSRVTARGFCLGPASALAGDGRLLVATFDFTAMITPESP